MKRQKRKLLLGIDRALSQSFWKQFGILATILIGFIIISYILLVFSVPQCKDFCEAKGLNYWWLPLYLVIDPNALNNLYMNDNPELSVHRWMLFASSVSYIIGVIGFNGLLIGVITNIIEHRVQDHRDGLLHYLRRGHHVIMGYDDMVPSIITDIFERDSKAEVLILTSFDAKIIKERLKKSVARDRLDHIIVNYGQKTASEYFKDIHLESAKDIFVIGYRQQPAHDAVNVECVDSICSYLASVESKEKPECIICMFEDIDTYAALKTSDIFTKVKDLNMEFIPYNFYNGWTKQVFVTRKYSEKNNKKPQPYPVIYGEGIKPNDKKHVHMVIVGSNNFASTIAIEAAHMHHFPNFDKDHSQKTRITFIDHKADLEMPLFFTRTRHFSEVQPFLYCDMSVKNAKYAPEIHKELLSQDIDKFNFLDVEFEFIKGDVFSKQVQDLLRQWAVDNEQCLSVFLAMTDQRNNFIMGMNMPDEIYENRIPIFIRQERADNFVTNLRKADSTNLDYNYIKNKGVEREERKGRYAYIYPFGMEDMAYCFDETSLKRAKLINYIYDYLYKYLGEKLALGEKDEGELKKYMLSVVDMMMADTPDIIRTECDKAWKKLSVAKKWSNFYCADNIKCKLDTLRVMRGREITPNDILTDDEVRVVAVMEHNRWNVEKLFMGFRVAKPVECFYDIKDTIEHNEVKYKGDLMDKFWDNYGNVKDNNKNLFIHSDIRPYDELNTKGKLLNEITAYCIPWILRMTEKEDDEKKGNNKI